MKFKGYQAISWDFMGFHFEVNSGTSITSISGISGISRDFGQFQVISRYFNVFQGISRDFKGFQGIYQDFKGFLGLSICTTLHNFAQPWTL